MVRKFLVFALLIASCTAPARQALPTPTLPVITLSTPQVYDCGNGTIGGIKIKSSDVTFQNCKITASSDFAVEIRTPPGGKNITFYNVQISNYFSEGSGFDIQNTDGTCVQNVLIEGVTISGPMGWGMTGRLCNSTIRNVTISGIGQAGGAGKHGLYINNWTGIVFENVVIKDIWNSGIKIIGTVKNLQFVNVTCSNIGRSKQYGSCVMLGEGVTGRNSAISDLTFLNLVSTSAMDGAISVDDTRNPILRVSVNGVYYARLVSIKNLSSLVTVTPTVQATKTPTLTPTATSTPVPTVTPECHWFVAIGKNICVHP